MSKRDERHQDRLARMQASLQSGEAPALPRRSLATGALPAQGLLREELERTRAELASSVRVVSLDPARIRHSALRDRVEQGFADKAYLALRQDIARERTNTVPIKVRPVEADPDHDYEVVYGHRRHRACLDEGVDVRAVVEAVDDRQMLLEMHRENADRSDLSPYEQSLKLRRMLDEGVFPDQQSLGEHLGLKQAAVSHALSLSALPADVVALFKDPRQITQRLGRLLRARLDSPGLRAKLRAAAKNGPVEAKVISEVLAEVAGPATAMEGRTRSGVQVTAHKSGPGMQLQIDRHLDQAQLDRLATFLEGL